MALGFFWDMNVSLTIWAPDKSQGRVGRQLPRLTQWSSVPRDKIMNIRNHLEEISKILLFVSISPSQVVCTPSSLGSTLGPSLASTSSVTCEEQRDQRIKLIGKGLQSGLSSVPTHQAFLPRSAVVISQVKTIITVYYQPFSLTLKMRGKRAQWTVSEMPTQTLKGTPSCGTKMKRPLMYILQCP